MEQLKRRSELWQRKMPDVRTAVEHLLLDLDDAYKTTSALIRFRSCIAARTEALRLIRHLDAQIHKDDLAAHAEFESCSEGRLQS